VSGPIILHYHIKDTLCEGALIFSHAAASSIPNDLSGSIILRGDSKGADRCKSFSLQ